MLLSIFTNRVAQECIEINTSTKLQLDHNINMIPIVSLYKLTITTLGISSHQEGIHGLKVIEACFSLHSSFHWLLIAELSWAVYKDVCPLLPLLLCWSVWHKKAFTLFWFREGHSHYLFPLADIACWSIQQAQMKQRYSSNSLWADVSPAFFTTAMVILYNPPWASWPHHLCPFPLGLHPFSWFADKQVGFFWSSYSVTWIKYSRVFSFICFNGVMCKQVVFEPPPENHAVKTLNW